MSLENLSSSEPKQKLQPELNFAPNEMAELLFQEQNDLREVVQQAQGLLQNKGVNEAITPQELSNLKMERFLLEMQRTGNNMQISDGEIVREYFYSTGQQIDITQLSESQKDTLAMRVFLRLYIIIQSGAADELADISANLRGKYGSQYAQAFMRAYEASFSEQKTASSLSRLEQNLAENKAEMEKIKQQIDSKQGRSIGSLLWGKVSGNDQELLNKLRQEKEKEAQILKEMGELKSSPQDLSRLQENFRYIVYKEILREHITGMSLGFATETAETQNYTRAWNQENFDKALMSSEVRRQANTDMQPSFGYIESITSGNEIEKTKALLDAVSEMILKGQDRNKIIKFILDYGERGLQGLMRLAGAPKDMTATATWLIDTALRPYETTPEQVAAKKKELLQKVESVYAVLSQPEHANAYHKMKSLMNIASLYSGVMIDQEVTLNEVIENARRAGTVEDQYFTAQDKQRKFAEFFQETSEQYHQLTDAYIAKTGEAQQELILDEYLGIHSNDRFGHDGSFRAKIQERFDGKDPLRQAMRYLPFGKALGLDRVKLSSYEERAKSFREEQDKLAESGEARTFIVEQMNEQGEITSVEKPWNQMSDTEKELICQRECHQGQDEAYIGTGWEKLDQTNPFLSFSAQAVIADVMIASTPTLARGGLCLLKIGSRIILAPITIPALLKQGAKAILSKEFYRLIGKEALKTITPRITLEAAKLLSKSITEKVLVKLGVMLAKALAKMGIKAEIAAGANVVPIAGQIFSAGMALWLAYDAYEIGGLYLRAGRIGDACEKRKNNIERVEYDAPTQAFVDDYLKSHLPENPSEEDYINCQTEALQHCPKGSYKVYNQGMDGYIEYFLSQGEIQRVVLVENGTQEEITLQELENPALPKTALESTEAVRLEAGFTQLKLTKRSKDYLEIGRYDNSEVLFAKQQDGKWFLEKYPELKFEKEPQVVLLANLINKLLGIAHANKDQSAFQNDGQHEIEINNGYVLDTTYLSTEAAQWYEKQLGISSEQIVKIINHLR